MPSTSSAEPNPPRVTAADRAFAARRQAAQERPSTRRRNLAIIGGLAVLVLLGAAFGRTPEYGDIVGDAAAMRSADKAEAERGGSICVGWPSELTISAKPPSVAPDQVVVYLTQQGWNFAIGSELAATGATIELSSDGEEPAAFREAGNAPPGVQITASDGETATIRPTTEVPPADQPMITTRCTVRSVTIEVRDAAGQPIARDVVGLANGSTVANPVTFAREVRTASTKPD